MQAHYNENFTFMIAYSLQHVSDENICKSQWNREENEIEIHVKSYEARMKI